jgi:hypothetical protein
VEQLEGRLQEMNLAVANLESENRDLRVQNQQQQVKLV